MITEVKSREKASWKIIPQYYETLSIDNPYPDQSTWIINEILKSTRSGDVILKGESRNSSD
jgi:hypothetical protein